MAGRLFDRNDNGPKRGRSALRFLLIAFLSGTVFVGVVLAAGYAAGTYSSGTYGGGVYGTGDATPPTTPVPSGGGGGAQIFGSGPTAPGYVNTNPTGTSSAALSLVPTSSAAVSTAAFVFTRDVSLGSTGADVWQLQLFLNAKGFPVASSGPGSPGNETTYFGLATQAALAKFQAASGITPAAGYFGPKTRAFMTGTSTSAPAPAQPIASSTAPIFTHDLQLGDTGEDVRALQQYLNAHGFQLASYGPGSPGNETDLFGLATQYQLAQFQKANGLPATGFFGPLTRAAIAGMSTTTAQ